MTLVEFQKALREGKAVTNDGGKTFITIENGAFALWDGETTQLLSASPYIKFRPDGFLNDDTGYELFSNFSNKPILTESEKKYLANVIRPFRDKLKIKISKYRQDDGDYYVSIHINNELFTYFHDIDLAPFGPNEMYTGMELNKKYSLEELGL